jgi:hypothetical protein
MNADTRRKALIWFWYPESVGCINETKKATGYVITQLTLSTLKMLIQLTHTEVTTTVSTVYTTLDYECRHEKKGTGLALVPRKCGVHK